MNPDYPDWFEMLTCSRPYPWQADLASDPKPGDRLIRVPTGFGKTAGTVLAWLWHRVVRGDDAWPRRLAFCLPMRVLVEQTEAAVRGWLDGAGLLWDGRGDHEGRVGVQLLMGGADAGEWHLHPEHPAILIGTQDMLLSRALNRGYASPRARWPMEFGLLNHDCLWVMDEVQLMDVGLATSAQLQAFRTADAASAFRPCRSWWMSATLQPDWLASVDTAELVAGLGPPLVIPAATRTGELWRVRKPVRRLAVEAAASTLATPVVEGHASLVDGPHGRITLAIVNTVDRAQELHAALASRLGAGTDLRLVHSRFRPAERVAWRREFLGREHCRSGVDRIIVATQVVEAGVDISAGYLVTDLAPWPSLVQRFGRAARYGGSAEVIVAVRPVDDASARPYAAEELTAADTVALARVVDAAQGSLEDFEAGLTVAERTRIYPYSPDHLLLRDEYDELFDTTPDLGGADLDISRYIRSGDERDCLVFWAPWEGDAPPPTLQPARDALCPVAFLRVRDWLCGHGGEGLKEHCRALVLDYVQGTWRLARRRDLVPGRVVLVDPAWGGYDAALGFTGVRVGRKDVPPPAVPPAAAAADLVADSAQDREDISVTGYQTIATHGAEVGRQAAALAHRLVPALAPLFDLAGRWHDVGKAHPAFQASIIATDRPPRSDLAKAPGQAWADRRRLYDAGEALGRRGGFRHELASALALLETLARHCPDHPALALADSRPSEGGESDPLAAELRALDADAFDLVLYLVAAHHGKVRAALHATADDQRFPFVARLGHPIRGVCDGDELPAVPIACTDGRVAALAATSLCLAPAHLGISTRYGRSWRERTLMLQRRFGPAALAWLETLLRVADIRASCEAIVDPLLTREATP